MKRLTLSVVALLLLPGCAGLPGGVQSSTSKFDGERQIAVAPGWLPNSGGATLKLGGYWSAKAPNSFFLDVLHWGYEPVQSVRVNIDGEVVDLGRGVRVTDYDSSLPQNRQRYVVPMALVDRLVASRSAVFRVSLGTTHAEGEFKSGITCAKSGFVSAVRKIHEARS